MMMRVLMFVSVAGAVAYPLIPVGVSEPEWNAGTKVSTAKLEPSPQVDRQLRSSWGPTLKSLGRDPEAQAVVPQQREAPKPRQETVYWQGDVQPKQASQPAANAGMAAKAGIATAEHASWARIILAAKAHSEASVSSPITKFYPAGTELRIVGRESGWVEFLDPSTQRRGFVFEKYVVAIDAPSPVQSIAQAPAGPAPASVAAKTTSPKAQAPRQAKPMQQAANDVSPAGVDEAALSERKRDRLTRKEMRRERGLLGLFGRREPAPWTVGTPR